MTRNRSGLAIASFVALAAGLVTVSVSGQNPPPASSAVRPPVQVPLDSFKLQPPASLSSVRTLVQEMRDGKRIVLDPATKKVARENQDALNVFAKSLVYVLTDKVYYTPPEPTKSELKPLPAELTLDSRFEDASRYILVPTWGKKLTVDQRDYITGFGEAMDAAILDILQPKPAKAGDPTPLVPEIMQVNAARMLALAAKSGAPAHYPTILKLLQNPDTDPAVLIYAIKAAEGLIAAFDPIWITDVKYAIHTIKDAEMLKLALALDAIVKRTKPYGVQPKPTRPMTQPEPELPPPPMPKAGTGKAAPPPIAGQIQSEMVDKDQQMVIRYYRRAALRALAQLRFPQFVDPQSGAAFRPIMTVAKMAIGDPTITSSPGNDEVAIAVGGLLNLHDFRDINFDVLCDCIAQGVLNYAGKKAGNVQDKSIPWKITGSYLITALNDWAKIPLAGRYGNKIGVLSALLVGRVLEPLEKSSPTNVPNLDAVGRWREQNPQATLKLFIDANEPPLRPGFVATP